MKDIDKHFLLSAYSIWTILGTSLRLNSSQQNLAVESLGPWSVDLADVLTMLLSPVLSYLPFYLSLFICAQELRMPLSFA